MDTKSLSSRQVHWAQKLSCYHVQINYHQGKANRAADGLSQYFERNAKEEAIFQVGNVKILYCMQSLLTNTSLSGLMLFEPNLSSLYQVLVCRTHILLQLHQF